MHYDYSQNDDHKISFKMLYGQCVYFQLVKKCYSQYVTNRHNTQELTRAMSQCYSHHLSKLVTMFVTIFDISHTFQIF